MNSGTEIARKISNSCNLIGYLGLLIIYALDVLAERHSLKALRGKSVFTDNDTGMRYRGPDDLASALENANSG